MADQVIAASIFADSDNAYVLMGGDTLLVREGVTVQSNFGSAAGIVTTAGTSNALVLKGSVRANIAIGSINPQSVITITETGRVEGKLCAFMLSGSHYINNFGYISGEKCINS